MASILQRLIRKHQPPTTTLIKRILSSPTHLPDPKPDPPIFPIPLFNNESTPHPPHPLTFYPTFSISGFLNPVSETGYIVVPEEEEEKNDVEKEGGMWADSVKKKRKKKMNKHKLKKLRKRLRRKT